MSQVLKASAVAILGLWLAVPAMAAQRVVPRAVGPRVVARAPIVRAPIVVRQPRVVIRSYAPFGYYGYYGPSWYYPSYGYYSYGVRPAMGEIKIDTHMKDGSVYVDGGYVGPISKFKKFGLNPGNHDIEIRDGSGRSIFSQRVQVIVDRSVEIKPAS